MTSIQFPRMISRGRTQIVTDPKAATSQNTIALLNSSKTSLFGDPEFGSNLERFRFMQNNQILQDVVTNDLFTSLQIYIPQLRLTRDNIKIIRNNVTLFAKVDALNMVDFKVNGFEIPLMSME